ncbi:divalent-cation tolerance protein CutA [Streptomyces sp. NPDC049555]|uniref:divalent-cation tolerance protein CutA n=1 Tax=unclassified Streptomyces TaxID=2593676 RepID=UPI0034317278
MSEESFLLVATTTDSAERARALAAGAVAARLAACAQIDGPLTSVYRWQGAIETATEWRVLYKTPAARYRELEAHIKAEHTYDVPEVVATEVVTGSADYLAWLREETAPGS